MGAVTETTPEGVTVLAGKIGTGAVVLLTVAEEVLDW